jgi:hypothetical protein
LARNEQTCIASNIGVGVIVVQNNGPGIVAVDSNYSGPAELAPNQVRALRVVDNVYVKSVDETSSIEFDFTPTFK